MGLSTIKRGDKMFITKHTNAIVEIDQHSVNGIYSCFIKWNDGEISGETARTMNEINKFLLSQDLGEIND